MPQTEKLNNRRHESVQLDYSHDVRLLSKIQNLITEILSIFSHHFFLYLNHSLSVHRVVKSHSRKFPASKHMAVTG